MFHRNRTVMGSMACTALLFLLSAISLSTAANTEKQTYIVHMKHAARPQSYTNHRDWYSSSLHSLTSAASDSVLYTYDAAFHGFSATLSPHEAEILRRSDSVIGVYEDTVYTLHTTRSPHFLGLDENIEYFDGHNSLDIDQASTDIIIGVVHSGVWPESRSFDDSGMPEIPARWKGDCESGPDFSPDLCNKKLIGTRFFSKGYRTATGGNPKDVESPRDRDGHGTHTASTAAGSPVANASLFGYASGTARGMATSARVAMYKVCWSDGCFTSDILAGLDRAISDGVDVLSISLGSSSSAPYYHDTIAIGTFTAVEKGIFVSCSAGNEGPAKATLSNVAPWVMTIGAGTLDRDFPAYGLLGNKKRFTGASVYSGPGMGDEPVKLVYDERNSSSKMCLPGSLEPELVRGKVAVCDAGYVGFVEKGMVVRNAGGVGMVIATANGGAKGLVAESYMLPAMMIGKKEGDMIKEYTRSDPNPSVVLSFRGATLNVQPSPLVAGFSSRGPNVVTPQILKPDIIGPGVNILAAWSEAVGPSGLEIDCRKTTFNIMSGTSMSSPHISGIAALLKAARPDWSPSAIKSALMTTAYNLDNTHSPLQDAAAGAGPSLSNPWAHGSGYVNPRKALYPGLVYDISTDDYVTFLCSLNYTIGQVRAIVKRPNISCSSKFDDPGELNYPSFSVVFANKTVVRYTRELTNVGAAPSVYEVAVTAPPTVKVTVKPAELVFRKVGDKCRYRVTFVAKNAANPPGTNEFGSIVWRNAQHQARSPFALAWI